MPRCEQRRHPDPTYRTDACGQLYDDPTVRFFTSMGLLAVCVVLLLRSSALCQEWQVETAGSVRIHFTPQNAAAVQSLKPLVADALDHIARHLKTGQPDSIDLYLVAVH